MKKSDLKAGDVLIDFQMGYARNFTVTEEDGNLFMQSGETKHLIEDSNIQRVRLLITSDDDKE